MANPVGRPSDYYPEVNQEMRKFFDTWPDYIAIEEEVASGGRVVKVKTRKQNVPPTINKFSIKSQISREALLDWSKKYPEFGRTYAYCKSIQEEFLCNKGLLGEYNQGITRLMLVNHTPIQDKVVHEVAATGITLNVAPEDINL
jgi:hypothetical protein